MVEFEKDLGLTYTFGVLFGKRVGGRGPSFSLSGVTYVFTPDMGTLKTVFPN